MRPRWYGWASLALLIAAIACRRPLESSMFLHMLVQIPAILVSGFLAARLWSTRVRTAGTAPGGRIQALWRHGEKLNEYGVPGLLMVSFVGIYWMIPKALDQVMVSLPAECLKFAVLFVSGMVLMHSVSRSNNVIKLFFVGNFSWMMAIVGMLYQENTQRLCNFYLLNDQEQTGIGLVTLAVLLPILWLLIEIKAVRRYLLR